MDWKTQMDDKRKGIQVQLKDLKKQRTKARMDNVLLTKIQKTIDQLEIEAKRYDSRGFEPVALPGGLVVNIKVVRKFLAKMKGATVTFHLNEHDLQIAYKTKTGRGRLILTDRREYFIGCVLPVREVDSDGQIDFT